MPEQRISPKNVGAFQKIYEDYQRNPGFYEGHQRRDEFLNAVKLYGEYQTEQAAVKKPITPVTPTLPTNPVPQKAQPAKKADNYDYRGAFVKGIKPDANGHWPSMDGGGKWLKSPEHPTAWKEAYYQTTGINPDKAGVTYENLTKEQQAKLSEKLPQDWGITELPPEQEAKFNEWISTLERSNLSVKNMKPLAPGEVIDDSDGSFPVKEKKMSALVKARNSWINGSYQLVDLVGGGLIWSGLNEELGEQIRTFGKEVLKDYEVEALQKEFELSDLQHAEFYYTKLVQMMPMMTAIIPVAMAGGAVGGTAGVAIATAVNLGTKGTTIVTGVTAAVTAALASRPLESTMEAIGTYNQLIDDGVPKEKAGEAASQVFVDNMTLIGMDAAQYAAAFYLVPAVLRIPMSTFLAKTGWKALGFAASGLSEGYEEVIQNYFQELGTAAAKGEVPPEFMEAVKLSSPEAKEAFALGFLGGQVFQLAGLASKDNKLDIDKLIDEELARLQALHPEEKPPAAPPAAAASAEPQDKKEQGVVDALNKGLEETGLGLKTEFSEQQKIDFTNQLKTERPDLGEETVNKIVARVFNEPLGKEEKTDEAKTTEPSPKIEPKKKIEKAKPVAKEDTKKEVEKPKAEPKTIADTHEIIETEQNKTRRIKYGRTEIVEVDAKALQDKIESDMDRKLAWDKTRLANALKRESSNEYPFVDVLGSGKVDITDGGHRIAAAAQKGQKINIAVKPGAGEKINTALQTIPKAEKATKTEYTDDLVINDKTKFENKFFPDDIDQDEGKANLSKAKEDYSGKIRTRVESELPIKLDEKQTDDFVKTVWFHIDNGKGTYGENYGKMTFGEIVDEDIQELKNNIEKEPQGTVVQEVIDGKGTQQFRFHEWGRWYVLDNKGNKWGSYKTKGEAMEAAKNATPAEEAPKPAKAEPTKVEPKVETKTEAVPDATADIKIQKYINKINNPPKWGYAKEYAKWVKNGREGKPPMTHEGLPAKVAKLVRESIDKLTKPAASTAKKAATSADDTKTPKKKETAAKAKLGGKKSKAATVVESQTIGKSRYKVYSDGRITKTYKKVEETIPKAQYQKAVNRSKGGTKAAQTKAFGTVTVPEKFIKQGDMPATEAMRGMDFGEDYDMSGYQVGFNKAFKNTKGEGNADTIEEGALNDVVAKYGYGAVHDRTGSIDLDKIVSLIDNEFINAREGVFNTLPEERAIEENLFEAMDEADFAFENDPAAQAAQEDMTTATDQEAQDFFDMIDKFKEETSEETDEDIERSDTEKARPITTGTKAAVPKQIEIPSGNRTAQQDKEAGRIDETLAGAAKKALHPDKQAYQQEIKDVEKFLRLAQKDLKIALDKGFPTDGIKQDIKDGKNYVNELKAKQLEVNKQIDRQIDIAEQQEVTVSQIETEEFNKNPNAIEDGIKQQNDMLKDPAPIARSVEDEGLAKVPTRKSVPKKETDKQREIVKLKESIASTEKQIKAPGLTAAVRNGLQNSLSKLKKLLADEGGWIRIGKTKGMGFFIKSKDGKTLTAREMDRVRDKLGDEFTFANEELENDFNAAAANTDPNVFQRIKDFSTHIWERATREYENLKKDQSPELQFLLRTLKKQKGVANDATITNIKAVIKGLSKPDYKLFTKMVVMQDLHESALRGEPLPFKLTEEIIDEELARMNDYILDRGKGQIWKALEARADLWLNLQRKYEGAMSNIGMNVDGRFNRPNYFRHIVLDYAKINSLLSIGGKLKSPTGRDFLKTRRGSELAIKTDYLYAEMEVMSQMIYDIQVATAITEINNKYNIHGEILAGLETPEEKKLWKKHIPEGYRVWQPEKGNRFYVADAIPHSLALEALIAGIDEMSGVELTADKIRTVLAVGSKKTEYVLPNEIADTLDNFTTSKDRKGLGRLAKWLTKRWKIWTLISPRRFFRYNFRNFTGDLEAALIINPQSILKSLKAATELYHAHTGDKVMTPQLRRWFVRGGFESTLQIQEIGDVNKLKEFIHLHDQNTNIFKKAWNGYWKMARGVTDFRESILRYASFISYEEQLENGTLKNYGASSKTQVESLSNNSDKAFMLSNDALGAYDRIGLLGQDVREMAIPFWSWQEVNFRRYIQLIKNTADKNQITSNIGLKVGAKSVGTAIRVGKFAVKATGLLSMLSIWNYMFFRDEEEELSDQERSTPHIIFGRDDEGNILSFNRLGILGDFVEWFGLDAAPRDVYAWLNGKKSLGEVLTEIAKAPVNKLVQGINPLIKTPLAELPTRRSYFPDVFKPYLIRDRGVHIARSVGLENEYKALTGKPAKPYKKSIKGLLLYSTDPLQSAYSRNYQNKISFLNSIGVDNEGYFMNSKSNALYNYKAAIRLRDEKAAAKYYLEYLDIVNLINPKITAEEMTANINKSFESMNPLAGMNQDLRNRYILSLTEAETNVLLKAVKYYEDTLLAEEDTEFYDKVDKELIKLEEKRHR